jgi:hypothetical protein
MERKPSGWRTRFNSLIMCKKEVKEERSEGEQREGGRIIEEGGS